MGPDPLDGVRELPLDLPGQGVSASLRARFFSNWGVALNSADAGWAKFKVMVTSADGSQTAMTLAQLGITQVNLQTDAIEIRLMDGYKILGNAIHSDRNWLGADRA